MFLFGCCLFPLPAFVCPLFCILTTIFALSTPLVSFPPSWLPSLIKDANSCFLCVISLKSTPSSWSKNLNSSLLAHVFFSFFLSFTFFLFSFFFLSIFLLSVIFSFYFFFFLFLFFSFLFFLSFPFFFVFFPFLHFCSLISSENRTKIFLTILFFWSCFFPFSSFFIKNVSIFMFTKTSNLV